MAESSTKDGSRVKIDGEEAVLHITDQSVMFERGGMVSGFERSAIRMVKPDGDVMIIAYSVGNEVRSVRVEPIIAVASLAVPEASAISPQTSPSGLGEIFERLYKETRKELEERLVKVEVQPENKTLRLSPEERQKYIAIRNQMTGIIESKYNTNPETESLLSFWGLEDRPHELQVSVVKIMHIDFLLGIVSSRAETEDVGYQAIQVWPHDWPRILGHFDLGNDLYVSPVFGHYVDNLKSHWEYSPSSRRPALVS